MKDGRANNGGKNKKPECWWLNSKGYIEGQVWMPDGSKIRIRKHRFIVQGILGRPLEKWEDVHHKDRVKTNNHPDNLQVIAHGEHAKLTNSQRDYSTGYKLKLTEQQRKARSLRAIAQQLSKLGHAVQTKNAKTKNTKP